MDKDEIRYDEYGVRYRRFNTRLRLIGYSFRTDWYPISDESADRFLILTLLGGWLGIHKFKAREYVQGLMYLLTCGGFGVFYVFDVLSIVTGTYSVMQTEYMEDVDGSLDRIRKRVYLDRIGTGWVRWPALILSVFIGYVTFRYIYIGSLEAIFGSIWKGVYHAG